MTGVYVHQIQLVQHVCVVKWNVVVNTIIQFIRQEVGGTGPGTNAGGGGGGQSRLQLGMFTIFPAFGIVLPNGHATVTVDCAPEAIGKFEEVT